MSDDLTEELRRVQEEVRFLKADLVALGRVVQEAVVFQSLVALDISGEKCERAASAARILRMVADLRTPP
jgi:hypothetical protein